MKLTTLADNFGILLEAPTGLQQLRGLILRLASSGQLFSLGTQIAGLTVQLNELGSWAIGSGIPQRIQGETGNEILVCKVSDMNLPGNDKYIYQTVNSISVKTAEENGIKIHPKGTVIFPKIGGAIATNKRRILNQSTAIDNNCLGITPASSCTTDWLYLTLKSIDFSIYQSGTSVPALSQGTIGKIPIFLPNTSEQQRICSRVNHLIQLCDELEQKQALILRLRSKIAASMCEAVLKPGFGISDTSNTKGNTPSEIRM